MQLLKRFPAFLLLVLFLYPFIQKGIHDIGHADDFHCYERSLKHFHTLEHHCGICDEVFSLGEEPEINPTFCILSKEIPVTYGFPIFTSEKITRRYFSLRAPPQVC